MPKPLLRTLLSIAVLSSGGCSWIFSEGPPPNHAQMPYFECSTNIAPPVLDTIWGALNLAGALLAAGADEDEIEDRGSTMIVGFSWAVISGAA